MDSDGVAKIEQDRDKFKDETDLLTEMKDILIMESLKLIVMDIQI
jgi:hypothetical protein